MLRVCAVFVLCLFCPPVLADVTGPILVIDADTIDVGGTRIRLHGIDAPEVDQTCRTEHGVDYQCGVWARDKVRGAFQHRMARCTVVDTDRYGRQVATCDAGGADMGRTLVQQGWAFAYRKYSMAYDLDEKGAAIRDAGLHALRVQSPAQFRTARAKGRTPVDPACVIKGNISQHGRIFHVPGQAFYARTGINLSRGERWFCSADEARAAGWRAARR
ncbi:MAG: thermonuclease family protein [Pseudomonadota bacterium]